MTNNQFCLSKIRTTEVLPIHTFRAISDLFIPRLKSFFTSAAFFAAVAGRLCEWPWVWAWAIPAFTRSLRMSRSNSAKAADIPLNVNAHRRSSTETLSPIRPQY